MPLVPLPFIAALLFAILLAVVARRGEASRRLLALLAICAVQSVLAGLRWGYGIVELRFAMPVLAATIPPLILACFATLSRPLERRWTSAWPIAIPPILAGALVATRLDWVEPALIALYLGVAAQLLRLARDGPDALRFARLDGVGPAHRALAVAAGVLAATALVDIVVLLDFEWMRGAHAGAVIGAGYLAILLALGLCAAVTASARPASDTAAAPEPPAPAPSPDAAEDDEAMARIDELMRTRGLYRDPDLSLDRLARRAGLPARRISAAINRATGRNVSQWVNDHRIAEACRLLAETDRPVTAVLFDAGFQTKSNFNREFRRVTGTTPVLWRAGERAQPSSGTAAATAPQPMAMG